MPRDPGSRFGALFGVCIRDEYVKEDWSTAVEGAILVILGAVSGVATTYLLSLAGVFV